MNAVLLNMIANIISFSLSLVISFFLTPYITRNVGLEAYGLVGLANSFVGYITILTSALNSMASRFIIINIHKKDYEKANTYFSSVLYANTAIAFLLLIPSIWLIWNIDVLNVSSQLLVDAQCTFALIGLSFVINLLYARYGVVLYAKNILWKGSFRVIESNILRVALIFGFFYYFHPQIYFVVLATFISGIYPIVFNVYYSRKKLPELRVDRKLFSLHAVWELVSSGIWNSITKLGQILLDGLDLLLSNLFINGVMTGNVSIAKTVPMLYTTLVATLSDSFQPRFLELYSKSNLECLVRELKNSISVLSCISGICLSLLFVYAEDFYTLWVPSADSRILRNITYCAVGTSLISGCVYTLFSVFSLTNKLKANSIAILLTGFLSAGTTFLCLKYTDYGVYAIVGVSSIFGIVRNLTFTPIYAAKCLNRPIWIFYPIIFKNLLNICSLVSLFSIVRYYYPVSSWTTLVGNSIIDSLSGFIITYFIVLNKNEKEIILRLLKIKK